MKPPKDRKKCSHVFCEFWGDKIMCTDCQPALNIEENTFPGVYRREMAWREKLGKEDISPPEEKANRAVTIQFLLDFCNYYNLWDVSTRQVRRDYVIPMTSAKRCRFVDLPSMMANNIVGPSNIFVSHTWSGKFGDVVAGVCDGRSDYSVRIWLDIFATLQWPTTKVVEELKFEVAVQRSASFVIVCPTLRYTEWCRGTEEMKSIRLTLPFFRGWCIYEIFFAMITPGVTVIVKFGGHIVSEKSSLSSKKAPHIFEDDPEGIFRIAAFIDIERADFSQPTDRPYILGIASGYPGGLAGLNMTVKNKLGGAYFSSPYPLVRTYAWQQGGEDVRSLIKMNAEKNVIGVAAEGCTYLLEEMLRSNQFLVHVTQDKTRRTPLMAAAAGGNLPRLQIIVGAGAAVNWVDMNHLSALHFGAIFYNSSSLTFLLKSGANIDSKDCRGMTALLFAASGGHLSCVEVLVSSGADVNARDSVYYKTALMFAAEGGHLSCVEVLAKSGADINDKRTDMTALMCAAKGGHLSCVEFLVKSGADVNAKTTYGHVTALMYAVMGGHLPCVEVLVNSGADVNATENDGRTALMLATAGCFLSCVDLLVKSGANVNATASYRRHKYYGFTALLFAAREGHLPCLEALVKSGADVNPKENNYGSTALMYAAREGHLSCVRGVGEKRS